MRIAIVKPDYNIYGGFEVVMDRIVEGLKEKGHAVDYIKVDMVKPRYELNRMNIPPEVFHANEEFFRYVVAAERFSQLNVSGYDLVMTTQPPSFAVNHPKVVPLFYHHLKIYYDLYDVYKNRMAAGIDHEFTRDVIREIDSYYLTNDKFYIAGSRTIADRLKHFNGIDRHLYTFAAGINDEYYNYSGPVSFDEPICVGRHEFPKRPELFCHAMKHIKGLKGKIIGHGGKTDDLKLMDRYLTWLHESGKEISDDELWKELMSDVSKIKVPAKVRSNVIFTGRLTNEQLVKEYASALCIVCPAYEEDYGLTAIEAMAFKKPVIVCSDGGGLTEFIENGVNGFIVEPTGEAIAGAIRKLKDDPELLSRMSRNAYESSRHYSWASAIDGINRILEEIHTNY